MKVLLLTKKSEWCRRAQMIVQDRYPRLTIYEGESGSPLPPLVRSWTGDLILSFVCPWILPVTVIGNSTLAMNFHPGPPEHPGFAPYSWALYQGDSSYGITVHHMTPEVDAGMIVHVTRFPLLKTYSVLRLQQLSMEYLVQAIDSLTLADYGMNSGDRWARPARTRRDFETLRTLQKTMSPDEVLRRTRACDYPGQPGAEFEVQR